MSNKIKVSGHDAYRDTNSGAIVFNNSSAYEARKLRKRKENSERKKDNQIKELQGDIQELKNLVNALLKSKE